AVGDHHQHGRSGGGHGSRDGSGSHRLHQEAVPQRGDPGRHQPPGEEGRSLNERSMTESRLSSDAVPGRDLLAELRTTLERANELLRVVETSQQGAAVREAGSAEERIAELERRLSTAESDVKELASRLVDSEHQGGRLMNLYVATYQLHATLDPAEVQATIAEIAINLLGAEQFALLLRRDEAPEDEARGYEIALIEGF